MSNDVVEVMKRLWNWPESTKHPEQGIELIEFIDSDLIAIVLHDDLEGKELEELITLFDPEEYTISWDTTREQLSIVLKFKLC
jgi:hypothetical protein